MSTAACREHGTMYCRVCYPTMCMADLQWLEELKLASEQVVQEMAYLYEWHTQTDEELATAGITDAIAWRRLRRAIGGNGV
jgi:hypothetical protein